MAYALQIPCITRHYFPDTVESIKKLCQAAGFQSNVPEGATCCGLPYFEKGELLQAKSIGEYNLSVYGQNQVLSLSPKCCNTLSHHYPDIFNNTVSHNEATQLARHLISLPELLKKIAPERFKTIKAQYFFVSECCQSERLNPENIGIPGITWLYSTLHPTCCGAGTSLPVSDHHLSIKMALALLDSFKASGAEAIVFEDDICRKHVLNAAASAQIELTHFHITDIIARAL